MEKGLKFMGAWFCPYAQRAWIALEHSKLKYTSVEGLVIQEDESYWKHPDLLAFNSKGLVPTIIDPSKNQAAFESIICVEYVNDLMSAKASAASPLLPLDPMDKATCRRVAAWVDKEICSPFYRVLVRKEDKERKDAFDTIVSNLKKFSALLSNSNGALFNGGNLCLVDITLIPWAYRLYLLKEYRGENYDIEAIIKNDSEGLKNYEIWYKTMISIPSVKATLQPKDKLTAVYRRYADGTAKSKVGEAVRDGKEAHDIE